MPPWIAFVACDANSTNSSSEADVFTLAKDRGAKSAVSLTSSMVSDGFMIL